jgi:hypothetical protein
MSFNHRIAATKYDEAPSKSRKAKATHGNSTFGLSELLFGCGKPKL